jgi:enterochelin esterase-like enzyme
LRFWIARLLLFALTLSPCLAAQECPAFDRFLQRVNAAADDAAKKVLVEEFIGCVRRRDTPLIQEAAVPGMGRATFFYRGPASTVLLAGDMNRWTQEDTFSQVAGTDLFYLSREFELDARLEYKLVLSGKEWIFDPLNSRRITGGFGPNSFFAMPEYSLPPEFDSHANIPHGTIEEIAFNSRILGNSRMVKIYLPPSYAASHARYRTLYVHDGIDYLNLAKINEIVDVMIHRNEIPPVILVMVPPVDRDREYWTSADFARAFATELVPTIDKRYRTEAALESRGILGASLGGLIAVYIAGQYPQVFGNCAGQSSAFFPDSRFEKIWASPKSGIRFHLDVGTYEQNYSQRDLLNGNRRMRDFLRAKAYTVDYRELHEGHSWGSWRVRIPEVLRFFWGPSDRSTSTH